jgi:DNA repair exonuclease SbcCD ATPase subunit
MQHLDPLEVIHKNLIGRFLLGESLSTLTNTTGLSFHNIYSILQSHFRSGADCSRSGRGRKSSSISDPDSTTECPMCLLAELHDLKNKNQLQEEQIVAYTEKLAETEPEVESLRSAVRDQEETISEWRARFEEAGSRIEDMNERHWRSLAEKDRFITELIDEIKHLKTEVTRRDECIQALERELETRENEAVEWHHRVDGIDDHDLPQSEP